MDTINPVNPVRAWLTREELVQLPGAYDCITALMVEKTGFPGIYLTGSGISLSLLGQPDLNTVSYLELRQVVQNIRAAVRIPMLVDIDTGFDSPLNLIRLVKDFERLGINAVQIEDQRAPKKCGHELGRRLVSPEEMASRIETICENRRPDGLVVVARTDARTTLGLEDAIRRANRYVQAGADVIFVESPESYDEVCRIVKEVDAPILFNNVEGGRSPFLSREELTAAGVRFAIYPNTQTRVITHQCTKLLTCLNETGTTAAMQGNMLSHKDLFALFDHDTWVELETRYTYQEESEEDDKI